MADTTPERINLVVKVKMSLFLDRFHSSNHCLSPITSWKIVVLMCSWLYSSVIDHFYSAHSSYFNELSSCIITTILSYLISYHLNANFPSGFRALQCYFFNKIFMSVAFIESCRFLFLLSRCTR